VDVPEVVYDRAAAQRAWARRRDDLHRLAGVGAVLTDLDQQIADLHDRVEVLLNGEST
jgi:predicted flap endonuclease-1-like 5' DNA nuclease